MLFIAPSVCEEGRLRKTEPCLETKGPKSLGSGDGVILQHPANMKHLLSANQYVPWHPRATLSKSRPPNPEWSDLKAGSRHSESEGKLVSTGMGTSESTEGPGRGPPWWFYSPLFLPFKLSRKCSLQIYLGHRTKINII